MKNTAWIPTLALALCACRSGALPTAGPERFPQPTDPRGQGDDETRRRERERWIEEMHRTAPDVDWRAVERANQEAERVRRNALAASAPDRPIVPVPGGAWEEVGSRNQAGHTRCAALGPARDGQRTLYVGSANGGLWRGPEDGSAWEPISDALFGGVDEVVVLEPADLADDDIVVMHRGASVYRSDDGGTTWTVPAGLAAVQNVRRTLLLPDGQQTILLLTQADVGPSGATRTALYASADLGQSFQLRWNSPTNWRADMWTPRFGAGAGSDVYVLQQGRVRKSVDGGHSFALQGDVDTLASEGSLQGSEAGAPGLYAALLVNGAWKLFRSADAGVTWSFQKDLSGYWGAVTSLAAFSTDPDAVFYGGVEGFRSFNGGLNFQKVNGWGEYYGDPANKLHADLRGISPIPDPDFPGVFDRLYVNTDGGTYLSMDLGLTVQNLSLDGLGVGQFYSTHTSVKDPALIVGGTQDQGYQRGFKMPSVPVGPSTPFDQLISGDYGHLTSSDGDHDYVYSTYPGFILIQIGEAAPALDTEDFPAGASNLWLPPVVADPLDEEAFFFLADHLWRYVKSGSAWNEVQHSTKNFASGAGSYLSALAFAPTDPLRAYAVTDAGRLWHSADRGVTWTEALDSGPSSHYFYGNALAAHPTDTLRAVAGGSGYSTPGVRRTVDGGVTWQALDAGLPPTLVYDLVWAPDGSDDVYAATEAGAYRYDAAAGAWENIMGVQAPATTYWSVEAVPAERIIRFGTYGRGIWDFRYGSPPTTLLFLDGFESGGYAAGGWWTKNLKARIAGAAARTGTWGARLRKTTWARVAVSTAGYATVQLEYSRRTKNYVAGEELSVEWWDGSAWQTVEATADTAWSDVGVTLPAAAGGKPDFELRFRTTSQTPKSRADVDDVRLYGTR